MIDWWALFHDALWIIGLAVVLATASIAGYQASVEGTRFGPTIVRPGFQHSLLLGLALACLGWLLGEGPWWARAIWGLLAAMLVGTVWLQRRHGRLATVRSAARATGKEPVAVWRGRRVGWGLVITGLLVLVAWAGVSSLHVARHARSLRAHARDLETLAQGSADALGAESLAAMGEHLTGMRSDLASIQRWAGHLLPLGRILRYLPRYGGDLGAASDLLDLALGTVSAGGRVFQALAPALELESALGTSLSERLLSVVAEARPELLAAHDEVAAAELARARIDAGRLSPPVADLLAQLDAALPWLRVGVDGLLLAPQVLGVDGPRTYLILAQNNQELRPTGGFISGVGELTALRGRFSVLTFRDSYAVDNWEVPHDLAPPDLQATLSGDLWLFRDANWLADFPASARRALETYARDQGVEADGVVALDLTAVVLLVEALGPLEVEGIDGSVTGQNVVEAIQASWQSPPDSPNLQETEWFQDRKDAFGAVASAAMERLLGGGDVDPLRVALALRQALDEKHILVYLDEPQGAILLRRTGWDGALPDPSGPRDFLMVVDTNVGFNKVDPNVERSIAYRVDLTTVSRPQARLMLTYTNVSQRPRLFCVQEAIYGETYADMMERCYWDYVRVYVPTGSRLLKSPELPLPSGSLLARLGGGPENAKLAAQLTEGDWTAWTAFFDLAPGDEQTLTSEYRLPTFVLERTREQITYRLYVQKQPGSEAVPFCLEVLPPMGFELAGSIPARGVLPEPTCTDLRTDREFEIVFRAGDNQ